MPAGKKSIAEVPEISAVGAVYNALKDLDPSTQTRVLRYSAEMLGLTLGNFAAAGRNEQGEGNESRATEAVQTLPPTRASGADSGDEIEGVSAVARKWMKRSGLGSNDLQKLFSLGIDEIDLVAKSVPGKSKRERMRSVLLLKGIAAYLGTGVARVAHKQLKEACVHYNAYDVANFARHLKEFQSEVSGSKETGYTLSARGLNSATEIVKGMLPSK